MTLKNTRKNKRKNIYSNWLIEQNKRARIFIGLVIADVNSLISPWNFLESDRLLALTSFEIQ